MADAHFCGNLKSRTFYLRLGRLLSGVGIFACDRDPADRCLTIRLVDLLIDQNGVSGDAENLRKFLKGPQGEMPGILCLLPGVKWASESPNERPPWISSEGSFAFYAGGNGRKLLGWVFALVRCRIAGRLIDQMSVFWKNAGN